MKHLNTFFYAVLAGLAIGIGGTCFLSLSDGSAFGKVIGALFFTVGLFTICTRGYHLFTGKVCYLLSNKPSYLLTLLLIWLGNFCGATSLGLVLRLTRIGDRIGSVAASLAQQKLDDNLLSIFLLSVACNILIYIAVDGFRNNSHEIGKYLALFLGVAGFILCGFEHCIANMFYFAAAGFWFQEEALKTLLYLLIMTLGNAVGGLFFPVVERIFRPRP